MSLHLKTPEYECKNCRTPFMAYCKGLECPKCKVVEESNGEGYNFIEDQARALLVHKNIYKQFTPHGWYSGSYCDNLQWALFGLFDEKYKNKAIDWEDQVREIELIDGDENRFKNESYLLNLFNEIDKKLVIMLEDFERKKLEEKERRKLVNLVKRFFNFK